MHVLPTVMFSYNSRKESFSSLICDEHSMCQLTGFPKIRQIILSLNSSKLSRRSIVLCEAY